MKKQKSAHLAYVILAIAFLTAVSLTAVANSNSGRSIDPLVSTTWLYENSGAENLVILDVRTAAEYAAGHIANAINVPFEVPISAWIAMRENLILEMPDDASLFNVIGANGITHDSRIVIVTTIDTPPVPPYSPAGGTRVAATLIYAGLKNVAILDGGFPKWQAEGKPVTTALPAVTPVTYYGEIRREMIVSIDYVKSHLNRVVLLDNRDADVYFGIKVEPFAPKAGHIPSARSLPTPWMWNEDGTYKPADVLSAMAFGVIAGYFPTHYTGSRDIMEPGASVSCKTMELYEGKEIIVYCGVGGYASSWWYVLTQILNYKHVKLFDGSAQEWVQTYDMVKYTWYY
jgi:thiosulfate/3-mercaptopyruvate sulfurtransferase